MNSNVSSSQIEEREQWRAKIDRALAELRGDDERLAQSRSRDDDARKSERDAGV